jgi:ubiquitin-protein ligase
MAAIVGNPSAASLKRLLRDLKELSIHPVPGAALEPPNDSNIFELHGNLIIPEGPYEGLLIHFILILDSTFPITSPSGRIAPGYPFDGTHHLHIHGDRLCNDYLRDFESHFKMLDGGERKSASGWSPGITLSNLLMVLKNFFAETDLKEKPRAQTIQNLFERVRSYHCPSCSHTGTNPFPQIITNDAEGKKEIVDPAEESAERVRARNLLVCSSSKENYIDNPKMVLGYPIHLNMDSRKRLWTTLIPEYTSYEQYALQIQEKGIAKLNQFNHILLRTGGGSLYNHWIPLYICEEHYQQNLQYIKNTISVISNGTSSGSKENDFRPEMVFRVLLSIMNKMVVAMMNGDIYESENAIYAYCHFLRLFMRFLDSGLQPLLESKVNAFVQSAQERSKDKVPDIGEFIIMVALSQKYNLYHPDLQKKLLEEYFSRQVFWIQKKLSEENVSFRGGAAVSADQTLAKHFELAKVSNHLLIFNYMAARFFIFDGVRAKLDSAYGLPPEFVVGNFQKMIKQIKAVSDYKTMMMAIQFEKQLSTNLLMIQFLQNAEVLSKKSRYTLSNSLSFPW